MEGKEIIDKIIIGRVEPYIYAFTTNTVPNYLKIGDTYRPVPIRLNEWKTYFPDLKEEYKEKALVSSDVFFRDYAVHKYVEEELGKARLKEDVLPKEIYYSNEFFENATDSDVKEAIDDIKESYKNNDNKYQFYDANTNLPEIFQFKREDKEWNPRPNQQEAIDNFINARNSGRKNLLMYAVMRFGKSFTSMMCAKEMEAKLVVVVSAKADVKLEWKKTVEQPKNFEGYYFISADELGRNNNEISDRLSKGEKITVFLTLQDLQGDLIKEKHKDIFKNKIDLLIVDETHFGARAEKYGKILENTKYEKDVKDKHEKEEDSITDLNKNLKILDADMTLHLSGTPYRILMGSEFEKEDIISFCQFSDIVKEQSKWDDENLLNDEIKEWDNPYFGFPQMIRFAFNPSKKAKEKLKEYKTNGYTYAFSALLKPESIKKAEDGSHKKFINEQEILELFEVIDGSKEDENVLGFLNYDKIKQGKMCRHIVCVLPYCASCDALENLIISNKDKFKNLNEYEIINISGVENSNQYKTISAIKDKIKEYEKNNKKTLTLTVNRMLTGSTVEEWDTMIYLKDTASPQEYDQAIFRLQNQYIKKYVGENGDTIKYNMKPQTLLVDFDPYRLFSLQEQKSMIYNVNVEDSGNSLLKERLKNELEISPIIVVNSNKIVEITPNDIMEFVSQYSRNKGVMDETNEIPVDFTLLNYSEIKSIIEKQAELGSNQGLSIDNANEEDGQDIEIPSMDDKNNFNDETTIENDSNKEEDDKTDDNSIEKRFRTYYARILFYTFLTNDIVISLSDIVDTIENNENNRRIANNLGLSKKILSLINNNMNVFMLSQLDYKIQNISKLSKDDTLNPIERANIAVNKFKKLSESEIVTPNHICKDMISLISDEQLKNICESQKKFLDIASKMGEFALAIYEILVHKLNISHEKVRNIIYSIPTSSVAYEFTRKIYEILDLNISNIAMLFNLYDLLGIKDRNENVNYLQIKKYLMQDKEFSKVELIDNIFYKEGINKMKFDVVVGNPPYQENVGNPNSNGSLAKQLYPVFMTIGIKLDPDYMSFITPSRWFTGEGQDASFPPLRKFIKENNHIKTIVNYGDNKDVFSEENIGSVNYFLYDKEHEGNVNFFEIIDGKETYSNRPLFEEDMDEIIHLNVLVNILNKVYKRDDFKSLKNITTGRNPFKVPETNSSLAKVIVNEKDEQHNIKIRCANDTINYTSIDIVNRNYELVDKWKVYSSKMNGAAGTLMDSKQVSIIGKAFIGEPKSICSGALITFGCFDNEIEALNLKKYMETKFLRVMVGIMKSSRAIYQTVYKFVPLQDFTEKSDIDWSKSIHEIDLQLYKKYNLNEEEIIYIEDKIKATE